MPEENVDLVRRAWADLGSDPSRFTTANLTEFVSPEIEFDLSPVYPDVPPVRGLDAAFRLRESLPWGRSIRMEPERFFDVDDECVLVFVHVTAEGRAAGLRSRCGTHTSSRFVTVSSSASRCTEIERRPLKPSGCRTRATALDEKQ